MLYPLLLLVACGTGIDSDSKARTTIEQGNRLEEGSSETWIRDARVICRDDWWDMRVAVNGIATSVEWAIDFDGEGEPHRMVADGWSPDSRIQNWTNESPYNPDKEFQVESHLPCQVGLNHMIWLQGSGANPVDCAFLGPNAAERAADLDWQVDCVALSYDDEWSIAG